MPVLHRWDEDDAGPAEAASSWRFDATDSESAADQESGLSELLFRTDWRIQIHVT